MANFDDLLLARLAGRSFEAFMLNITDFSPELRRRLQQLDAADTTHRAASPATHAAKRRVSLLAPVPDAPIDFDVVLVGGGLSLLVAPLLAARGLRVAVLERERAGTSQREWNASFGELQALVRAGLCDEATLRRFIVNRYDYGVCRWYGGGSYPVEGVLDCAVDATTLLEHTRLLAQARGVTIFDGALCEDVAGGLSAVRLACMYEDKPLTLTARLMLDGRGARSPYARTDLICPTVGGVLEGLTEGDGEDEVNPRVGEILATSEHVEQGRQHVWEVFPGKPGETTVYLFYYAQRHTVPAGALQALYARFAARLPHFKRGQARIVRPTFGYIPGWSRLGAGPKSPHPRIVLMGDAAARHSPLTFCGFGAMLRSLQPLADGVVARLDAAGDKLSRTLHAQSLVDDRPIHAATGALARMIASPPPDPPALNALLDAAFNTLHNMGNEAYASLLQDMMPMAQFIRFLRTTSTRRPNVYRDVWQSLGMRTTARWGLQVAQAMLQRSAPPPC